MRPAMQAHRVRFLGMRFDTGCRRNFPLFRSFAKQGLWKIAYSLDAVSTAGMLCVCALIKRDLAAAHTLNTPPRRGWRLPVGHVSHCPLTSTAPPCGQRDQVHRRLRAVAKGYALAASFRLILYGSWSRFSTGRHADTCHHNRGRAGPRMIGAGATGSFAD